MKSKPRNCNCCGREYYYCPHCREDENKPTWMMAWDTQECREVFITLSDYNSKNISKEQAKERISKVLTHTIVFKEKIQQQIDELFKEEQEQETVSRPRMRKSKAPRNNSDE